MSWDLPGRHAAAAAASRPVTPADIPAAGIATSCQAALAPVGCPCNPSAGAAAAVGTCSAGSVCAQPWADQAAAAANGTVVRRLLGSADATAAAAGGGAPYSCQACGFGQLCPPGSSLPPVLDGSFQL